ncbi:hypothetical protein J6590_072810 [Homalodisca vitripennis]|nr:hypothetical protein J6590_072810 [Homalodisca vitripennis]
MFDSDNFADIVVNLILVDWRVRPLPSTTHRRPPYTLLPTSCRLVVADFYHHTLRSQRADAVAAAVPTADFHVPPSSPKVMVKLSASEDLPSSTLSLSLSLSPPLQRRQGMPAYRGAYLSL